MKIKINRKHFVDIDNIEKIVVKDVPWVYLKEGYPRILKATKGLEKLKLALTNAGYVIFDFKLEYK